MRPSHDSRVHYPARLAFVLSCFLLATTAPSLNAKMSSWKDAQGASFRAEPVEALGPFAVFRKSRTSGGFFRLQALSPADCLRFYEETAARPARAASFAQAQGEATRELPGHVLRLQNGQLLPADLSGQPEPEVLVVLYGSHNDGESWQMANNYLAIHNRFQRVYPGRVATLFFGLRHKESEHRNIAASVWMPWLVTNLEDQSGMYLLKGFAPNEGALMVAMTRDGVPLFVERPDSIAAIRKFADELANLLAMTNPADPRGWKDRVHYLNTVRPREFAHGTSAPLLIGNPLRADRLRPHGVSRIEAKLEVAADGSVTGAELLPGSVLPDALRKPVAAGLRKAVLVPAMVNGTAVPGTCDYTLTVPPEDRQIEADAAWLDGSPYADVIIPSWLVLRPVHVEQQNFMSSVENVDAAGVAQMSKFEVSSAKVSRKSQMNAFNSDWFAEAGAGSVHPHEGDRQRVDEADLTWQRLPAVDGLVNFQSGVTNQDYCIGYAWTEFELPADVDGWLGIGSDDGLRIWHNGELVHDKWVRRISHLDDDVVPLHLKKGKNQILIKIQNATGDWSFISRLRVRDPHRP
jgi:hypothetical protein